MDHSTCEHPHVDSLDNGEGRRYKCSACGVLLHKRRPNMRNLTTYRCMYVEKVRIMNPDGTQATKREYTCLNPATHFGTHEAFCDEHGKPRESEAEKKRAREVEKNRKAQAKADKVLAERVIVEAREAAQLEPVRVVESSPDRLGGVIFF